MNRARIRNLSPLSPEIETVQSIVRAMLDAYERTPALYSVAPFITLLRQWEETLHAKEHHKRIYLRLEQEKRRGSGRAGRKRKAAKSKFKDAGHDEPKAASAGSPDGSSVG